MNHELNTEIAAHEEVRADIKRRIKVSHFMGAFSMIVALMGLLTTPNIFTYLLIGLAVWHSYLITKNKERIEYLDEKLAEMYKVRDIHKNNR